MSLLLWTEFADADVFEAASRAIEKLVEHFDADKGDHASDADEFVDTVAEVVDPGHFQPEVPVYELG